MTNKNLERLLELEAVKNNCDLDDIKKIIKENDS